MVRIRFPPATSHTNPSLGCAGWERGEHIEAGTCLVEHDSGTAFRMATKRQASLTAEVVNPRA